MEFKQFIQLDESALRFATKKHGKQIRKFDGSPYISHPIQVHGILKTVTNNKDILATSYLHDTIEDTDTTHQELVDNFGKKVADMVVELSNSDEDIKKFGKAKSLTRKMQKMSNGALIVKLADRQSNLSDWNTAPEKFVTKYFHETNYILSNLKRKFNKEQKILKDNIQFILDKIQEKYSLEIR